MSSIKTVNINVKLEFPPEVNLEGIVNQEYGIMHMHDFYEIIFTYCKLKSRSGYHHIKDDKYRWMFFLDTYEKYSPEESKELHMNYVFQQKWYKGKHMTVMFINKDFEVFTRVLPASEQEYIEEKSLFDDLYRVFKENQDFIGKYLKHDSTGPIKNV